MTCTCEKDRFSQSDNPKENKDCIQFHKTTAKVLIEFTASPDYWKFENGQFKYDDAAVWHDGSVTGDEGRREATLVIIIIRNNNTENNWGLLCEMRRCESVIVSG